MPTRKRSASLFVGFAIVAVAVVSATLAVAQEKILHSFGSKVNDGAQPVAGLVFDSGGNLYGTTKLGGSSALGTVFELSPAANGGWGEKVLFSFHRIRPGVHPVSGLILDSSGNLYGTTFDSGISTKGVAFELKHWPDGGWSEEVLYDFGTAGDAAHPAAGLVFDAAGNLYGTAENGGPQGLGRAFELTPAAGGGWTESITHDFTYVRATLDGFAPNSNLTLDAGGNLYGTTSLGGTYGDNYAGGIAFELSPAVGGGWTEVVLHNFGKRLFANGNDGSTPRAGLVLDSAGNLYGTTQLGGTHSSIINGIVIAGGTVFELTPTAGGVWTETVIHNFGSASDGNEPLAGLIFDASGNLYGTTSAGGAYGGGTAFKLTPSTDGTWAETILHSFGNGKDGATPAAGLILDGSGNLYGTTSAGGLYGNGTVFEITP